MSYVYKWKPSITVYGKISSIWSIYMSMGEAEDFRHVFSKTTRYMKGRTPYKIEIVLSII